MRYLSSVLFLLWTRGNIAAYDSLKMANKSDRHVLEI